MNGLRFFKVKRTKRNLMKNSFVTKYGEALIILWLEIDTFIFTKFYIIIFFNIVPFISLTLSSVLKLPNSRPAESSILISFTRVQSIDDVIVSSKMETAELNLFNLGKVGVWWF